MCTKQEILQLQNVKTCWWTHYVMLKLFLNGITTKKTLKLHIKVDGTPLMPKLLRHVV